MFVNCGDLLQAADVGYGNVMPIHETPSFPAIEEQQQHRNEREPNGTTFSSVNLVFSFSHLFTDKGPEAWVERIDLDIRP
jgi:hypothetical protein